jgi:exocyst complex component 4
MTSYNQSEDLGSILMRVIRTLSEITDSGEQREEEKRELERRFRESDQNLDSLVLQHQKELTKTMQVYAKVNNRLTDSRTRVKAMKERLVSCKELLHYKRDELKKLWLDGVEHKYVLQMLERIEELKDCPEKISSLLSKHQTLEATQVFVQALGFIYGDLKNVDGLVEVIEILDAKKEKLYETLLEDLSKQLYIQSTWEVENSFRERPGSFRNDNPFRRSGSYRGSSGACGKPPSLRKMNNSSGRKVEEMKREGSGKRLGGDLPIRARRLFLDSGSNNTTTQFKLISLVEEGEFQKILENPKYADVQEGPAHAIIIDVECLSLLNKLPDAIEHLKSELLNELQGIVTRSSTTLNESGPFPQGDNRLLPELFTMVVDQFGLVIDAYKLFSLAIQKSHERTQCEFVRFDLAEVWARVQSTVQMMLTDYLDFKSSKSAAVAQQNAAMQNTIPGSTLSGGLGNGATGPISVTSVNTSYTDNAGTIADINSYFVRRKTQKPKRESLFRFDYSSTAISMNDYLKEQNSEGAKEKALVCPPNPHNITSIYPSLMDFVGIVESALKCDPGTHCTLYAFLMDYIKDVFLGQIHADNGNALNSASLSLDSWKAITDSDILRELKVNRPLLQSTVSVKQSIDELNRYMRTLPLYCEHFLTMICNMVMQYKEICLAAYRGVVQPESEDKRIISAQWAKDDDIARFLRSLPNWQAVKTPDADTAESPQEVEQRNAKETAMLKGNLGASEIPSHEILYDPVQLRSLAQLQESLVRNFFLLLKHVNLFGTTMD